MPWEFLAGYAATKALDAFLFSERLRPKFRFKGFAERYQSLTAEQLNAFYRNETPLAIELLAKHYVLPMTLVTGPTENGLSGVVCSRISEKYSIPEALIDYSAPVLKEIEADKNSHDGRVTRLASFDNDKMVLQEASYYEGVATNFTMDHRPKERKESLREFLHAETGAFGDFESSSVVNHLGVVCMVETSDGKLVVQHRGRKVTNRAGTLSSSASGVLDWNDVAFREDGFPIEELAGAALRESFEELHVEIEKVVFLGLVREFLRGGKPEIYFYARVDVPFKVLYSNWKKRAEDRYESKDLSGHEFHSDRLNGSELSRDKFKENVGCMLEAVGDDANLTLTAGIMLTARYLLDKSSEG